MERFIRLNRRYWWVVAAVLLAVVTAGSLDPRVPLPNVVPQDKIRHLVAYAAIAFPIALARPRGWIVLMIGLLVWSIGIEMLQPFVGRSRDIRDFIANAAGVGLAVVTSQLLWRAAAAFRRWLQSRPFRRISPFDGS